jgi:rRNA maturation endonuclease Nob1
MQVLDYGGHEDVHVCLSCDAEFAVNLINGDDEQLTVDFCPCCGSPLDEIDNEMDEEED